MHLYVYVDYIHKKYINIILTYVSIHRCCMDLLGIFLNLQQLDPLNDPASQWISKVNQTALQDKREFLEFKVANPSPKSMVVVVSASPKRWDR